MASGGAGPFRALILAAGMLVMTSINANAEIYQYVDGNGVLHIVSDLGSIPERQRGQAKIIEDDDHGPSSTSGLPNKTPDVNRQGLADTGPGPSGPSSAGTAKAEPAQQAPSAQREAPPDRPNQQLATKNTGTRHNGSGVEEFFISQFQSLLNEKFKDVKDPSQLPALRADHTADCTKYKKSLDEDLTRMDAWMKDMEKRKAQGDSGVFMKLRAVGGLRRLVNMIYDVAFTPKNCMEEFERENEGRLADFAK